jgi:hypothetical protein
MFHASPYLAPTGEAVRLYVRGQSLLRHGSRVYKLTPLPIPMLRLAPAIQSSGVPSPRPSGRVPPHPVFVRACRPVWASGHKIVFLTEKDRFGPRVFHIGQPTRGRRSLKALPYARSRPPTHTGDTAAARANLPRAGVGTLPHGCLCTFAGFRATMGDYRMRAIKIFFLCSIQFRAVCKASIF